MDVSPSGKFLAFGTETNEVYVYSLVNGVNFLGKGVGHSSPVSKIRWTPDEK